MASPRVKIPTCVYCSTKTAEPCKSGEEAGECGNWLANSPTVAPTKKSKDLLTGDGTAVSPSHYASMKIQPIEFIAANNIGFLEGNVIKYVCRHGSKNGLEDLKKAMRYLEHMMREYE